MLTFFVIFIRNRKRGTRYTNPAGFFCGTLCLFWLPFQDKESKVHAQPPCSCEDKKLRFAVWEVGHAIDAWPIHGAALERWQFRDALWPSYLLVRFSEAIPGWVHCRRCKSKSSKHFWIHAIALGSMEEQFGRRPSIGGCVVEGFLYCSPFEIIVSSSCTLWKHFCVSVQQSTKKCESLKCLFCAFAAVAWMFIAGCLSC